MKRCALVLITIFALTGAFADTENWKITKSTHFIVYYKKAPEDFIKQLIDKSEGEYNRIADDLGFRRYNFWLWDKRAKIYIYDSQPEYQVATGQPRWSSGSVSARDKIIKTFPYAQGFFEMTLPHEMGHIIFREFVGFENSAVPLWLDEGVASYQEKTGETQGNRLIKQAINQGKIIDLEELGNLNPHAMHDSGLVNLFYAESLVLVDYLMKEFGKDNFVLFCQALRDKKDLERAIASVYPFSSIAELDKSWKEYLRNG